MSDEKSPVIKAATNEWLLLAFRVGALAFGGVAAALGTLIMMGVTDLRSSANELRFDLQDMRRTIAVNRLEDANRLGRVEGQVVEIKGSLDAHRRRLDGNDADIRSIWNRLFELRPTPPQQRMP